MTKRYFVFAVAAVCLCAFPVVGQTLTPVPVSTFVFDSVGRRVGVTVYDNNDVAFRKADDSLIFLRFYDDGGWVTTMMLFTGSACTGTAYAAGGVNPGDHPFIDGLNVLYSHSAATLTTISAQSILNQDSSCVDIPITTSAFGPLTQYVDLDTLYEPPFHRSLVPPPAAPSFSDVPATHPFYQYIEMFKAAGITAGCAAGQYCPDAYVTRGQMAVFIARVLGLRYGAN